MIANGHLYCCHPCGVPPRRPTLATARSALIRFPSAQFRRAASDRGGSTKRCVTATRLAALIAILGIAPPAVRELSASVPTAGLRRTPVPSWVDRVPAESLLRAPATQAKQQEPSTAAPPESAPGSAAAAPAEAAPAETTSPGASGPVLLQETQLLLARRGPPVSYRRLVVDLADRNALDRWSTLELAFSPPHEQLRLHEVRVRRGGEWSDRLASSRQRMAERQTELNASILSDEQSLLLILADLRVGDVLDAAWSVEGTNPVLGGRISQQLSLAPPGTARRRIRVLVDPGVTVSSRVLGDTVPSSTRTLGNGRREWLWEVDPPAEWQWEDGVPDDVLLEPELHLSSFANWAEVRDWGVALYTAESPRAELTQLTAEWRALAPPDRLLAALRFVQGEVRYLSLTEGEHTMRPRQPIEVLDSRWGDCKDKSILLVALLRELEIPAWPALVSTWRGSGLEAGLPSPGLFDHVIVAAEMAGAPVWMDATLPPQSPSGLEDLWLPRYTLGLELRPGLDSLSAIPLEASRRGEQHVEFDYHLADDLAHFTVEIATRRTGQLARDLRQDVAEAGLDDLTARYLAYYQADRETITGEPLRIEDADAPATVVTRERYRADLPDRSFALLPLEVGSLLPLPEADEERRLPLGLPHPLTHSETVRLHYAADEWEPVSDTIDNAWFRFTASSRTLADGFELSYALDTKSDRVAPTDLAAYRSAVERVGQTLGYEVWQPPAERHPGKAAAALGMGLVAFAGAAAQSRRLLRRLRPELR